MSGGTAGSAGRPTGTPYYGHPPLIWVLWAPVHWPEALLPGQHPSLGRVARHGGDAPPPYTGAGRDALPCGAGPLTPAPRPRIARRVARRGRTPTPHRCSPDPAPGPCGAGPLTPAPRSRIARCVARWERTPARHWAIPAPALGPCGAGPLTPAQRSRIARRVARR